MTSKSLFFKVQKEDLRGKTPLLFITFICMFLALPIFLAMEMQKYQQWLQNDPMSYTKKFLSQELAMYLGAENAVVLMIVLGLASIFAFCQFEYLYHREKVDFYHSIPVRRGILFWTRYLNGVVAFLIPYVICVLLGLAILSAGGFSSMMVVKTALLGCIVHTIGYLLCYSLTILAICLTGNFFTGVLGTITLQGYGIMLFLLVQELASDYFMTYMQEYENLDQIFKYTSPLYLYVDLAGNFSITDNMPQSKAIGMIIIALVYGIVLSFLAFYTYMKRASESAGKAIAFKKLKPILKVFIIALAACVGSLLFKTLVYDTVEFWQIVGFIFTLLLGHVLLQVIFEQDVKAVRKGIPSTIVAAVAGSMLFAGFFLGSGVYDNAKIDFENVEYVAVMPETIIKGNYGTNFYDMEDKRWWDMTDYAFKYMKITDKELLKDFINDCMGEKENAGGYVTSVAVKYTMKNGKEIYRRYSVDYDVVAGYMERFLANQEFRKGINYSFGMDADKIGEIDYQERRDDYEVTDVINIPKEKLPDLLKTYQEEYLNATVEELNEQVPIAVINPCGFDLDDNSYLELGALYVYPSFTKTLAIMKEGGMDVKADNDYQISKIKKITIHKVVSRKNQTQEYSGEAVEVSYYKKEQLEELVECIAFEPYCYNTGYSRSSELRNDYTVYVEYMNEQDYGYMGEFVKEVPDWVIADLDKEQQKQKEKADITNQE